MDNAVADVLGAPLRVPGRFGDDIVGKRRPQSPVLIIAPWNVPCGTIVPKLFVALLCGCHVVVKPSEYAPTSISRMCQTIHRTLVRSGFSTDGSVLQLVLGGAKVGSALVAACEIRCVQFTGAPKTAANVASGCAARLKPLLAECGGSNSLIVCDDADLVGAVRYCAMGLLTLNGQWCMGVSRVLVHHSVRDAFLHALKSYLRDRVRLMMHESDIVGSAPVGAAPPPPRTAKGGMDVPAESTVAAAVTLPLGPLSTDFHADTLRQAVSFLVASSSLSRQGGDTDRPPGPSPLVPLVDLQEIWTRPGPARVAEMKDAGTRCTCTALPHTFFTPVAVLEPDARLSSVTELFGPACSVHSFSTDDDAVRLSNLSPGQLACFVFSRDVERARHIGFQLHTGMVMVNSANFAMEVGDQSMDVACDFWGSAGVGTDGTGAAVAKFFSKCTWCGVSGSQDHTGHELSAE